jgi:hypothetical protein
MVPVTEVFVASEIWEARCPLNCAKYLKAMSLKVKVTLLKANLKQNNESFSIT